LDIWAPVVVSSLFSCYEVQEIKSYVLEQPYKRLESVKAKIFDTRIRYRGRSIEIVLSIDILALFADPGERFKIFKTQDQIELRISVQEFKYPLADPPDRLNFIADIQQFDWEGEVIRAELFLTFFIKLDVIVTRQQQVPILINSEATAASAQDNNYPEKEDLEKRLLKLVQENSELQRKIYIYEKDLMSLRRGIQKAERRSFRLNRENNEYRKQILELQEELQKQKNLILKYTSLDNSKKNLPERENDWNIRKRIKYLFLNNI